MKLQGKKTLSALLASALLLSLPACTTQPPVGEEPSTSAPQSSQDDVIKVKAVLVSASSEVTTNQANAMSDYAATQDNVDFSVEYYNQNVATMAQIIENSITAGVDVLILQPQSEGDCTEEVTKAVQAGIKVLLYSIDIPGSGYTYMWAEDSFALGKQMGEIAGNWANENLVANGQPVVAALGNYSVSPVAVDRYEGLKAGLEETCPEAQIVGVYEMAYKEEGLEAGENILQAHPDTNLVLGINDQSTIGVYEAFVSAGRGDETIGMFGIDGTAEAMKLIADGTMFKATLYIAADEVAVDMVKAGLAAVRGTDDAPKDQVIYWSAEEITPDTVEQFRQLWAD